MVQFDMVGIDELDQHPQNIDAHLFDPETLCPTFNEAGLQKTGFENV
jgi:hypothetical protein